jgi:hypothetical protein
MHAPLTFCPKARHTVRLISFSAGLSSTGNLQQHQTCSHLVKPRYNLSQRVQTQSNIGLLGTPAAAVHTFCKVNM